MKRDLNVYCQDILESIGKIHSYTRGLSVEEFMSNSQVYDAVLRRLEIIGEAVKHIPENVRKSHPHVPWKQVAGMRDVLVHAYFGIKLERIWDTIRQNLDALENAVQEIQAGQRKK